MTSGSARSAIVWITMNGHVTKVAVRRWPLREFMVEGVRGPSPITSRTVLTEYETIRIFSPSPEDARRRPRRDEPFQPLQGDRTQDHESPPRTGQRGTHLDPGLGRLGVRGRVQDRGRP